MAPRSFTFDERGVRNIQEATRQTLGQAQAGSQRRRQPPLLKGGDAAIKLLGPCGQFTLPEELDDTDFDVDFGGGCTGPSRYFVTVISVTGGPSQQILLEHEGGLVFSSDSFSYSCVSGSINLYIVLTLGGLDLGDCLVEFKKVSDDSVVATYWNNTCSWNQDQGQWIQYGPTTIDCSCGTFVFNLCVGVPDR